MEKLEDGTIIYSLQEAIQKFKECKPISLTAVESILLLLGSTGKPIHGRTLLMKELFLLQEEVLKKHLQNIPPEDMRFYGFRYGPYSSKVGKLLEELELLGYIERRGKKNTREESFSITDKGKRYIQRTLEQLPESLINEIRKHRIGWDELGIDGILRYVYEHYPEFLDRSELKEKYKGLTWGRGRG